MSFLYCVPGCDNNSVDWSRLGLDYAFEGDPQRGLNLEGFEGQESALLADQSLSAGRLRIDKESQTWKKCGDYYIGFWNDLRPTEELLRRKTQLAGKKIELDGQTWNVPTAVSFDEVDGELFSRHHLSRYVDFDEDGEPIYGEVEEQFSPLYDVAMQWMNSYDDGMTLGEIWKAAGLILSFNYRMNFPETCMLGLLTNQSAESILNICVDISSLVSLRAAREEDQKKSSTSVELNTNDGEMVGTGTTSQLVQT